MCIRDRDNVIICDPEDEYSPLVNRLGGQVIRLSPSSRDYVNPLDINLNYSCLLYTSPYRRIWATKPT